VQEGCGGVPVEACIWLADSHSPARASPRSSNDPRELIPSSNQGKVPMKITSRRRRRVQSRGWRAIRRRRDYAVENAALRRIGNDGGTVDLREGRRVFSRMEDRRRMGSTSRHYTRIIAAQVTDAFGDRKAESSYSGATACMCASPVDSEPRTSGASSRVDGKHPRQLPPGTSKARQA